jgi:hypothetical protein
MSRSPSEILDEILQTRTERRNARSPATSKAELGLLIASFVGIVVAIAGAAPKDIQVLGVSFGIGAVPRVLVLALFVVVIAYFLLSFVLYEARDRERTKDLGYKLENLDAELRNSGAPREDLVRLLRHRGITSRGPLSVRLWQFQRYGLPIAFAVLSLLVLLATTILNAISGA